MKLTIPQLNFMYLYVDAKKESVSVSRYDEMDTEEINMEMTKTLVLKVLNKYDLFKNIIDLSFGEKIDNITSNAGTANLHYLGADLKKKLTEVMSFKQNLVHLQNSADKKEFIKDYKSLKSSIKSIKTSLKDIEKALSTVEIKEEINDDNDDILDIFG